MERSDILRLSYLRKNSSFAGYTNESCHLIISNVNANGKRGRRLMEGSMARMQGVGITLMRVMVGIVFLVHGLQKLFVSGISGTAGFFESLAIPLPFVAAVVVTLVEVVGGAALILGLATRWVAIPLAIDMLVATLLVHLPNGFNAVPNGGYEFTLLLLVANVSLVLAGAGAFALDNLLAARGVQMYSPLTRFGGQDRPAAGFSASSRRQDEDR